MLHLHQYRLVCAIGVCFTRGAECTRCHGRDTLPGVRLNCRGSLPEAVAYGASLALWQRRLVEQADAVIVPSAFARERLRALGAPLPWERVHVLAPPVRAALDRPGLPSPGIRAALVVSRLAPEKGVDVAIDACRMAGIVAGGRRRRARAGGAAAARRGGRRCASRAASTTPSSPPSGRARRSRWRRRARPRRSGWPPPRRWPPACRWPPAAWGAARAGRRAGLVPAGDAGARWRRRSRAWPETSVRRANGLERVTGPCAPRRSWRARSEVLRRAGDAAAPEGISSGRVPSSALITASTGQDGSFLAELLLEKGYRVTGLVRGAPEQSLGCSEHLRERVELVRGDLLEPATLRAAIEQVRPQRDLPPGRPSFVPASWERPGETISAIAGSAAAILEAVREIDPGMRVFMSASGRSSATRPRARSGRTRRAGRRRPTRSPSSPRTSWSARCASTTACTPARASSSTTSPSAGRSSS